MLKHVVSQTHGVQRVNCSREDVRRRAGDQKEKKKESGGGMAITSGRNTLLTLM